MFHPIYFTDTVIVYIDNLAPFIYRYSQHMMQFDSENPVVKLCAEGIYLEGEPDKARDLYMQAWHIASNDFEKFTAAHYVARVQATVAAKLQWDQAALKHALDMGDSGVNGALPSLYLNTGKCYEDLGDYTNALKHYELGLSYTQYLGDDGYSSMVKNAIQNGIQRVS